MEIDTCAMDYREMHAGVHADVHADVQAGVQADTKQRYQQQKEVCERVLHEATAEHLWEAVKAFENYPLKTSSGLDFTYYFKTNRYGEKGNEIVVSRKEKTITRSSVEKAFETVVRLAQCADGSGRMEFPVQMSTPKQLGVFGASYIYPLFVQLGLVEHVGRRKIGERKHAEK